MSMSIYLRIMSSVGLFPCSARCVSREIIVSAATWFSKKTILASMWNLAWTPQRQLRDAWLAYAGTASDLCVGGPFLDAEHVLAAKQWLSGAVAYLRIVHRFAVDAGPKFCTVRLVHTLARNFT